MIFPLKTKGHKIIMPLSTALANSFLRSIIFYNLTVFSLTLYEIESNKSVISYLGTPGKSTNQSNIQYLLSTYLVL